MRRPSARGAVLFALIVFSACVSGDASAPPPPAPIREISDFALSYLNEALDIMQARSVNRMILDWPALRGRALQTAAHAQTYYDTYPAIQQAVKDLGDDHSRFVPPGYSASLVPVASGASVAAEPSGQRINGRIGYVLIPAFSSTSQSDVNEFARTIQGIIAQVDTAALCGWVVDLRGNTGGNMWPMLAGVGPILGNDTAGSFVERDGTVVATWYYHEGAAGASPGTVAARVSPPYHLRVAYPPVAVLYDRHTASSGEAIAVSFRGRPNSRSFGEHTYGVSSANSGFPLRDGAFLVLTVALDADRTGVIYGTALQPDEPVLPAATLTAGVQWLEARAECR